jgi:hypothetical protein
VRRGSKKKATELDALDAEEIAAATESPGYRLIAARIEAMLAAKRGELEQDLAPEATAAVRGFIAGVKRCLDVPRILIEEAKGK